MITMLELLSDSNERVFIFPQLIKYFKENKPGRNNQLYSMHERAKSVVVYAQDEMMYVMQDVDEILAALMGGGAGNGNEKA